MLGSPDTGLMLAVLGSTSRHNLVLFGGGFDDVLGVHGAELEQGAEGQRIRRGCGNRVGIVWIGVEVHFLRGSIVVLQHAVGLSDHLVSNLSVTIFTLREQG